VVKIKQFDFKLLFSFFAITVTKQLTSSITWPLDSSTVVCYKWSIVTMCRSCSVMEIWRLQCWTDGRTRGRTLRWFYTLSNAMHCIGQTKRLTYSLENRASALCFRFIIIMLLSLRNTPV